MDTKFLYVMGSESGVGKSTVCQGILAQLLVNSYSPDKIAYIKPVTQCTTKQNVGYFCERYHISYRDIGELVFANGFTRHFLTGPTQNTEALKSAVLASILKLSKEKSYVVIDGVGDPSVGSVVGVSNVDVATALPCRVLFVGKPGFGAAIDNTVLCVTFMQAKGIETVGLIYNKVLVKRDQRDELMKYLSKRLPKLLSNIRLFGFLGLQEDFDLKNIDSETMAHCFRRDIDTKALFGWLDN